MAALSQTVRQGKALYVGISSYSPEQTRTAAALLRDNGTPCLIHQPRYSLFSREIESGLLDVLGREGIGCIAFCPLAQGLLTNRYLNGIPTDSRAGKSTGFLKRQQVTPERITVIRKLDALATARGQSLAQMALTWVLRDQRVTAALIGASHVEQIAENIGALSAPPLSQAELEQINTVLQSG